MSAGRARDVEIQHGRSSPAPSVAPSVAHGMAHGVARFGALLRRHRLAAGLTQRELAERAGLSLSGVNALERGARRSPRPSAVARLADALDLAPDDRAAMAMAARRLPRPANIVLLPAPGTVSSAVRTIDTPEGRTNIPPQATPLLGRERELTDLLTLLCRPESRLVTLTGVGGVGKTRLAIAAAQALLAASVFPDGVWLVRLAPLSDSALVIPTIAQTLGLIETGGAPIKAHLRAFLHERVLLLLLDNFEHIAAAASQLAELLEWSAGLKLLVTSRAALRLLGEQRVPIPLLPVPPIAPAQPGGAAQLEQYAATALFLQRAGAAWPGFTATDANAPTVAAICARLDGLPLAIELAASWTRLLSPDALLARLERQSSLLTAGAMDLPERQRTMQATIAWSYGLLGDEERRLFRRLAVFVDGWTLRAAEAVCQTPVGAAPLTLDTLEGLGRLLDQSLIVRDVEDGEPRPSMLHVLRELALELLEDSGEAQALRRSHAYYVMDMAERIEPELRGPESVTWLRTVERELGNVRAALSWARASGAPDAIALGLRVATALWRFWFEGGHLSEGQQWIEALLALAESAQLSLPVRLRARADATAGILAAVRREMGRAMGYLEQAVALGRAADDWLALSIGLEMSGALLRLRGDLAVAERLFVEALAVGRAHGDALATYTPLASLAEVARQRGDLALAEALYTDALAVSRTAEHQRHVALMLRRLGELALMRDEDQRAAALLRESAEMIYTKGSSWGLINVIELLAAAHARMGREERAARLLGGAERLREEHVVPYVAAEQPDVDALVGPTRAALSGGMWAQPFAAGHALTLEEVYAETQCDAPESATGETSAKSADLSSSADAQHALTAERRARASQPVRASFEQLTRRELEVLRLLAEGQSDAQIARRLVISVRTVNHHVAAIYGKLGVPSRAAATRAALERHLL